MYYKELIALIATLVLHSTPLHAADMPSDLMVDLDSMTVPKSEFLCLALNDYFEARGEVLAGRLAVAKVVLNRAMDSRFPKWADNLQVSGRVGGHIFYRDHEDRRYAGGAIKRDPMVPALHRFEEWVEALVLSQTAGALRVAK